MIPWLLTPWSFATILALAPASAEGPLPPSAPSPSAVVREEVTVTGARAPRKSAESPLAVTVLDHARLTASAAPVVDQVLRDLPGFSLFRRTDSRFANPSTQGVSLRGTGASGASRAIVLADLVPQNDPFGGWVHWGRVPRLAIDRVEVVRGGASDLYGSSALGGVVQLVRRPVDRAIAEAEVSAGALATRDGTLFLGAPFGAWSASVGLDRATTDGYVPAARPGAIDRPLDSVRTATELSLARTFGERVRGFVRASRYDDDRGNGTVLQRNRTRIDGLAAGADVALARGTWSTRAWRDREDYHQSFSSIGANRATETLNRLQDVPATGTGVSSQLAWSLGAHAVALGGVDLGEVQGTTDETVPTGGPTAHVVAGGRQRSGALFAALAVTPRSDLRLEAGVRYDGWRIDEASRSVGPNGQPAATVTRFAPRRESAVSPRLGVVVGPDRACSLALSAYRAFRAPTLSDLYRSFRVGNVETAANENLLPETLDGVEGGLRCRTADGRTFARTTLFWSEVADPVTNVTLGTSGGVIHRQRQNLGRIRSRGVEFESETRLTSTFTLTSGAILVEPEVTYAPGQAAIAGRDIPQVPRRAFSLGLRYRSAGGTEASIGARFVGPQYDDDQNAFLMGGFTVVDLYARRPIGHGLALFVAVENLLGRSYETALTPSASVGMPRLARGGVRFSL